MTVSTVFGTSPEGSIQSEGTYAQARDGTGTFAVVGTLIQVGQQDVGSSVYRCFEGFLTFNASVIGSDVVSAVVLSLDGDGDTSTTDFTIKVRTYDFGASLTSVDYVAGASLESTGTYVASWASSGYSANYNAFTSEAAFPGAIISGTNRFLLYSDRQASNTTPPDNEFVRFSEAATAGTTSDPKLDITHASASTVSGPLTRPRLIGGMLTRSRLVN